MADHSASRRRTVLVVVIRVTVVVFEGSMKLQREVPRRGGEPLRGGALTRRLWLLGAGSLVLGCARAQWPPARAGARPSPRTIVLASTEVGFTSGGIIELCVYDDGWAYLSGWPGSHAKPGTVRMHYCLLLEPAVVESWVRRLQEPALVHLPRRYGPPPGAIVMDGGATSFGRPGDLFVIEDALAVHAAVADLRDEVGQLIDRVRRSGVSALTTPELPARARLLARHRWSRDRGAVVMDDLRIYDGGLLDYRLAWGRTRRRQPPPPRTPQLRQIDPAALDVLRERVAGVQPLGRQSLSGTAEHYETSLIEAGRCVVTTDSLTEHEAPASLGALIEELVGVRGYYADLVADA